jgi:hypothetical protein
MRRVRLEAAARIARLRDPASVRWHDILMIEANVIDEARTKLAGTDETGAQASHPKARRKKR